MAERLSATAGWDLADAIRNLQRPQRESVSGTAVFQRRDPDGTCWVTLPGSDAETPVNGEAIASASPGDEVRYEIRDGMLSITGNTTDPAVGMARATGITERIVERAKGALEAGIGSAQSVADAAARVANAVNQHFWSDTNGIHVTQVTQEEWAENQTGPNVLINSIGQLFRDGVTNLLSLLPAQTQTDTFEGDGSTTTYTLTSAPASMASVSVGGTTTTAYTVSGTSIIFSTAPSNGASVVVTYYTNDTAMVVWDGMGNAAANVLASFGKVMRIGRATESHMALDYHSMQMVDKEGNTYFHISDLRDAAGLIDQKSLRLCYQSPASTNWNEELIGATQVYSVTDRYENPLSFTTALTSRGIRVNFTTDEAVTSVFVYISYRGPMLTGESKAYTLGYRETNSDIGVMSLAEGMGTTASGFVSHVEGFASSASGTGAHAEGGWSDGVVNMAGGNASGDASHAEGYMTLAKGKGSHVQNIGTNALHEGQTAIGKYNDNQESNAFEIGNGTSNNARSNAFAVDWDGNIWSSGEVTFYAPSSLKPNIPGDPPTSFQYHGGIESFDSTGDRDYYSQTGHRPDDILYRSFVLCRTVNGSQVTNGFYLRIAANGTKSVTFTSGDEALWRTALGLGSYGPTSIPLSSATKAYSAYQTPKYRKCGDVVNVYGAVSPNTEVAAGGSLTIGNLPSGYRPSINSTWLCQGSGNAVWMLSINDDGSMTASRYRSGASANAAIPTNAWLTFNVTFLV